MVLKRERRGATLLLTVDRPTARNAINRELAERLRDSLQEATRDETVSSVVLASSGSEVFISGGDLKELSQLELGPGGADSVLQLGIQLGALEACPVPTIAAVGGAVFGGGCELLMMFDMIVMERRASLRFVHAKMGLTPAWGGTTRLIERIGATRAADLLLTARPVDAEEAQALGLVARLVDDGEALTAALALADELSTTDRAALVAVKRSIIESRLARRGEALQTERRVFRAAWGGEAHRSAFAAFLKKTK